MLAVSMPTSATALALVESATKCWAMAASSCACSRNQARAECALVSVSWVVNVLEAMMNREVAGSSEHSVDLGLHVGTAGIDWMVVAFAQRDMQHGTVFGDVDGVAAEHLLRPATDVGLAREIHQQRHGLGSGDVLGIIQQHVVEGAREPGIALRIVGKQLAHVDVAQLLMMRLQGLPGRRLSQTAILAVSNRGEVE